jgi:hypothetical protein
MGDPTSNYATVSIAIRIAEPRKPDHYVQVMILSVGDQQYPQLIFQQTSWWCFYTYSPLVFADDCISVSKQPFFYLRNLKKHAISYFINKQVSKHSSAILLHKWKYNSSSPYFIYDMDCCISLILLKEIAPDCLHGAVCSEKLTFSCDRCHITAFFGKRSSFTVNTGPLNGPHL